MYYVSIYARTSSPTSYTTCIYLPTSINIQTKHTIVQKVSSILFFLLNYPLLVLPSHHSINPVAVMINSYSMYRLDYERVCTYVWEPVSIVAYMNARNFLSFEPFFLPEATITLLSEVGSDGSHGR
jgi:hypothetical protein